MKPRTRKVVLGSGIAAVVIVVAIALTPVWVNLGLFNGMIRSALDGAIEGRIEFQQIRASWGGPQRIDGLRITDHHGYEHALVNVSASPGLLTLLFGPREIEATIDGTLHGEMYADGSISFQRLLRQPETDEPMNLEGVPAITLRVLGVAAHLRDVVSGQLFTLEDVTGFVVYEPGNGVAVELNSETIADGPDSTRGSMAFSGRLTRLFDADGLLTPRNAMVNAELDVRSVPVLGVEQIGAAMLHQLVLVASTENLAEQIALRLDADASVQSQPPSRLHGEMRVRMPMRPDGTLDVRLDQIDGELTGERVPSSLLQPFMPDLGIVLARDIGPMMTVDVRVDAGVEGVANVRVVGDRAELELIARLEDEWLIGDRLVIRTAQAHPDLVAGLTGLTVREPTDVELRLTSFAVPPLDPALDRRPLSRYALTGSIIVNGPATLVMVGEEPDDERTATLADLNAEFASPSLDDYLEVRGSMSLDGAAVTLDQRLTRLFDEEDVLDLMQAEFVGDMTVDGLPTTTIAQWMPGQEQMLRDTLGETVSATLRTQAPGPDEQGLRAELSLNAQQTEARMIAFRTPDALRVTETTASITLTQSLLDPFLAPDDEEAEGPMLTLVEPAVARVRLDPFELAGSAPADWDFTQIPLRGRIESDNLIVQQAALAEPVAFTGLGADFSADYNGEEQRYALTGNATVRRHAQDRNVASATFDVTAMIVGQTQMQGELDLADVSITDIEQMMGRDPGAFSGWVGESGRIAATFSGAGMAYEGRLTAQTPRLQGVFDAETTDDLIALRTDQSQITLAADAMRLLLAPENGTMTVTEDVPLTLTLDSRLPWGFLTGDPFDPFTLQLEANLTGGPLTMLYDAVGQRQQSIVENLVLNVRAEPVSDHIDFIIAIDADIRENQTAGGVEARGSLREAVRPGEPFDLFASRLTLDADFQLAPTSIVDAMLGMRGYLTSAVGPTMNAAINAENFSRDTGSISMNIDTEHGWLRARGDGQEGTLVIRPDPVTAELQVNPLLRERVLSGLHPLMADIVSAESPLRASFVDAVLPLDGNVSRLHGDVRVEIGNVEFDRGSGIFAVLAIAQVSAASLSGRIDPIEASIRNGVITYDRFLVHIGPLQMPWQGTIDLAAGDVRLRTSVPLGALVAATGVDLGAAANVLQVPLVVRGPLGESLATQIDPEFDLAGAMIEAGLRRGLEDIFRNRDGDRRLPPIFEDIIPRLPRRE